MNTLVIGHKGMLGSDLAAELAAQGHQTVGVDLPEFDLTNPYSAARLAAGEFGRGIEWVFNCAAYTAVDKAETDRDAAYSVNALGPGYLAQGCSMAGIKLMHVSTDFVFDGAKTEPYAESDVTNPLGVYGETKLEGERSVLALGGTVVRTAWLYGPNGPSFPRTMIRAWLADKKLSVVADQMGCPTYTLDLARVMIQLAELNAFPDTYHSVGPEAMTWHDFAGRAVRTYRDLSGSSKDIEIAPIRTEDWPTPAARPKYSVLSTQKIEALGIAPMRPVEAALREFVSRLPEP